MQRIRDITKFNPGCLIGNWNEDRELQRSILKDLLASRTMGTSTLDRFQQKLQCALSEVELTKVADDPYVHFGDVVQLVHVDTGCVVAGSPDEKDARPGEDCCSASGAPEIRAPCARNSLILLPYKAPRPGHVLEPEYPDSTLHYGQKVRLALHPSATGYPADSAGGPQPLFLFSKPISTTHYAKYSRFQLVGFTGKDSYDAVWQILTPDPAQRTMSEGVEVMAGAPILLMHAATQKPLCLEACKVPTDYGIELELSGKQATQTNKKLHMEQLATGVAKGFLPKGEYTDNYWAFVTGDKLASLPEPSSDAGGGEELMLSIVSELSTKHGALSLLERKLVLMENTKFELEAAELLLVLRQVGAAGMGPEHVEALLARFPSDRPGFVNTRALRAALRSSASS